MPDLRTNIELADRIFADYQQVTKFASRRAEIERSMQGDTASILAGIPVSETESPQFFTTGDVDPDIVASQPLNYFRELAVKKALDEKITELTANLAVFAVGHAVVVTPVDPESTHITQTYYSGGLTGSRRQERDTLRRPKKAIGSIATVLPVDNLLRVQPIRGTTASMNQGYYEIPVLDADGEPLVSIEPRELTMRDRPSKAGKVIDFMFSPLGIR